MDNVVISPGAYDEPTRECPYCKSDMMADWVDVGCGVVQCGPYHCYNCGASEIGPEYDDWSYKDREGNTIYTTSKRTYYSHLGKKVRSETNYSNRVIRYDAPVTKEELDVGYYKGRLSPYANTVNGELVDHVTAKEAYNVGMLDDKSELRG